LLHGFQWDSLKSVTPLRRVDRMSTKYGFKRPDYKRRRRWIDEVTASQELSAQAKGFLTWLTRWSDDELKQVWGDQQKMAETFGMAASQIRRYTHEGERAGFLHVHRCAPVRDEMTGRWCRRQTNIYSFTQVPPPTRKRRQKAQDCMSGLSPTGKRSISSLTGTSNRNPTKEESSPKP
jgi:hypothetical protein